MGTVPSPATWTAGEVPTAAKMNTNIRDNVSWILNPPRVKVLCAATQSIPDVTTTDVVWDTEVYDTDGMWASGANVTVQTSGLYAVNASIGLNGAGNTNMLHIVLRINGTSVGVVDRGPFSPSAPSCRTLTDEIRLNVNDTVRLGVFQNSGAARSLQGGTGQYQTTLSLRWVGV